ncbi:hypothetical protein K227x_47680 [Rubripirellula lacrimiformis]|uniref:Uncharacterized protein n=1 Tax=Rubripirellula lacrimiformis TaxID=1930273 RepID=A0A517NGU5_9BACT|nr:hypothetical protein [Rubripirellula lacrimiformis]QDT06359.1 hypothetical protein K227x_47680 [Rubripirellula lacrimiformis]
MNLPEASSLRCSDRQPAFPAATRIRWFLRGTAVGAMLMAAANAVSYFFRSSDWSGLVGRPRSMNSAIGFPWIVWEAGNQYGGLFADYPNMLLNLMIGLIVGGGMGCVAVWKRDFLNHVVEAIASHEVVNTEVASHEVANTEMGSQTRKSAPIQFSLRGLMIATTLATIVAAVISRLAAHPITLVIIYALGPISLVALAMVPYRWPWQRRVTLLIPITFALIAIAMLVGSKLQMEFDQVLLGIFLSWTPQSAIAATLLTTYLIMGATGTKQAA